MESPIELPSSPGAREITWVHDSAVSRSTSPYTLVDQIYEWPGQRYRVIIKLPSMSIEDGRAWQAFFADINGAAGSFWVRDSAFLRTDELGLGLPEMDGLHVSGATIKTKGWAPDRQVLRRGQKFEVGGRLRTATADCYSDPNGKAQIKCWPHCRSLAGGQPIEWQTPKGVFRASSVPEFTWDRNRLQAGFQFSADEVILP